MLRLLALILAIAGIGALFGPRRLRVLFLALAAAAALYTVLRLLGYVDGPQPSGMW